MESVKAEVGQGAMVMFRNKNGERCALPLIKIGKEWKQVGVFLKYGTSKVDPKFAAVFPLPRNWTPTDKVLRAIRKVNK